MGYVGKNTWGCLKNLVCVWVRKCKVFLSLLFVRGNQTAADHHAVSLKKELGIYENNNIFGSFNGTFVKRGDIRPVLRGY
jgi:hypothetical protein